MSESYSGEETRRRVGPHRSALREKFQELTGITDETVAWSAIYREWHKKVKLPPAWSEWTEQHADLAITFCTAMRHRIENDPLLIEIAKVLFHDCIEGR